MLPFRSAMFARPFAPGLSGNDPHWSNVSLLVGGLTGPGDESPLGHATSSTGGMLTTSTNPIANLLSIIKTASTGRMAFADHASFELGSGPWTIEGFFKWGNATAAGPGVYHYLINKWTPTGNQRQWALLWEGDSGAARLAFWWTANGSGGGAVHRTTLAFAPVVNTTYHIAADYDGTDLRIYVNGVMVGKATVALNIFNGTSALGLLGRADGAASDFPVGGTSMADEIRITKGVARYASDGGFANLVAGNMFIGWPRR